MIGLRAEAAAGPRPILLALAGDSASGKTTLSRGIEHILGAERVGRVCTDDYHRYDRRERARRGITPLVPEANRLDLLEGHLRELGLGRSIRKPVYDHRTGTLRPDEDVDPREIVIVEGLLPLAARGARDAIDVAVFLEPEEELRRRWKIERDTTQRGYTESQVLAELARRDVDAAQHVRPQRDFADIVVRFHRREGDDVRHLSCRLTIRPTLPYPGLRELVGSLSRRGYEPIRWSPATDSRGPMSVLAVDGRCPPDLGAEVEEVIWSYLHRDHRFQRDGIGIVRHGSGLEERSEALALAQLLIVAHVVGSLDVAFDL